MKQQRAEETRSHLLEAAETCFVRQGYDATSVAEICKQAGVSKGAFYHHFPGKQALFLTLLNRWLETLDTRFEAIRATTTDASEGIMQMAQMMQPIFQEVKGQWPILFEFWMQAGHDQVILEAAVSPYLRYRTYFADMFRAGIADGSLQVADADLAAQMLVSLAVGLLLQGLLDPDSADWGQVAQQSVRLLLQGMERRIR